MRSVSESSGCSSHSLDVTFVFIMRGGACVEAVFPLPPRGARLQCGVATEAVRSPCWPSGSFGLVSAMLETKAWGF